MGRIAEALKRAEEERGRARGGAEPSAMGTTTAVRERPALPRDDAGSTDSEAGPLPAAHPAAQPTDPPVGPININEGIHESIVPFYDRSSIVAEQYRSLRTRLLTQNPQNDHRVIAVTSAIPREGKSVTTSNLGVVLSEIRHFKVLCVDADFRRSRLAQLLDAKRGPGLADLLEGNATYEEVVQPTVIPNLYFVGAGETRGRTAAELLSSQRASAVMRRFQADFHYTLVDTPPATTVTDVGIIGQMCNGVIMIVRLNFTPEPVARRALRLLRVNKIPILGCLLIGRDERTVGYGYAYDYYRYYGYYNGRGKESKR